MSDGVAVELWEDVAGERDRAWVGEVGKLLFLAGQQEFLLVKQGCIGTWLCPCSSVPYFNRSIFLLVFANFLLFFLPGPVQR